MNWEQTLGRVKKLAGKKLKSISGKADIRVVAVDNEYVTVTAKDKNGRPKTVRRKTGELQAIVSKMERNVPIHVETEVHGGGSSRSHPETILANLPSVEWTKVEGRKHIVWVGEKTHPLGSLRKQE